MSDLAPRTDRLERRLAPLLRAGTWLSAAVIASGFLLDLLGHGAGARVMSAGILLFIALPIARLFAMLLFFLSRKDLRFALISAAVLATIATSFALGLHAAARR